MMQKVYILLPVHNRLAITELFIDCLVKQSYSNYHLVLIDDGSKDGTAEMVQAKIKNLTVLKGRGDWWWAGSLQQGINWLEQHGVEDRNIVLFANDDITFEADFLHKAVGILDGLDSTLLLPQVIDEVTGESQESGIEANLKKLTFKPASSPERINCLPTRGLFMRMSDLRRIGGFHPRLLPHYLSDFEFTIRAHRKGFNLHTSADLTIHFDREKTGYHQIENMEFHEFIKRCFSKKSSFNPVYWSTFILLAVPKLYIPFRLLWLWASTTRLLFMRFIGSICMQRKKSSR